MIPPTPLPGATPEVRAYAADLFRELARSWRRLQALVHQAGRDDRDYDHWSTVAADACNGAEDALLMAVLATVPDVDDVRLRRLPKIAGPVRGVALDGALYLAIPDPNRGTPHGQAAPDGMHAYELAVADLADVVAFEPERGAR